MSVACDVLVVGSGAAGCRAAYEAKKAFPALRVVLVCDGRVNAGGSSNLDASEALGINAPFDWTGDGDNAARYAADTIATGDRLADPALCRVLADEACDRVRELIELGVPFAKRDGSIIVQQRLSGCTRARSLTCGGGTGREITRALLRAARRLGVEIVENVRVRSLLKTEMGRVCGACGTRGGEAIQISAGAVVLASGGAGAIFSQNVNTPDVRGDGWAMGYAAGAKLINLEFFQIGPAVAYPQMKFIIHSHMWRLEPKLTNGRGEAFLPRYCPAGVSPAEALELKAMSYPFSVRTDAKYVDIAMFQEIVSGRGTEHGGVWFDLTHVPRQTFLEKAPITYERLLRAGVDLTRDKLELGLAVQNFNGGIRIDEHGFTGVPGLYAAGEITGGVHGADRPGGNNLTDTQVFGRRAGLAAAKAAAEAKDCGDMQRGTCGLPEPAAGDGEHRLIRESAQLFYRHMTVVRSADGLNEVLDFVREHRAKARSRTLQNRLLLGELLALPMLQREESRGTHYREDCPNRDEAFSNRMTISQSAAGTPLIAVD